MLYAPSNVYPSSLSGIGGGVIDVKDGLAAQWQVNGNSPLAAYQLSIFRNDSASTQLYTTGKVTLDKPFYGTDSTGTAVPFSATHIPAETLTSAGMVNGYADGYKMVIRQWWGDTDAESVTQTSASAFITRDKPTLALNAITTPYAGRVLTSTADYTQLQGDALNWVRWRIALSGSEDAPLLDTGDIYGTAELKCVYENLFAGNVYARRCDVQTSSGQTATTGWQTFRVAYDVLPPNGIVETECLRDERCIGVSWPTARTTTGDGSGDWHVSDDLLTLGSGAQVAWETENNAPIAYAPPYTILWKGYLDTGRGGKQLAVQTSGGILSFHADGTRLRLLLDETEISAQTVPEPVNGWWTVLVTDTAMHLQKLTEQGGLHPSPTLYPAPTLFPTQDTYLTASSWTAAVAAGYTQAEISAVTLFGPQKCDYMQIVGRALTASEIGEIMAATDYAPAWGSDVDFLANFADGLNAGNLNTTMYSLYRQDMSTGEVLKLADMDINTVAVKDFGARNQTPYRYILYYGGTETYTMAPITSETVAQCYWDWEILVCEEAADGTFRVKTVFAFGANVESGAVSNNASPGIQKNFTPYPLYQHDTANYRTGQLKALLGSVGENGYSDTVEAARELMELSASAEPKFLKDRKGNMIRIEIGGAITAEVEDAARVQPTTVTVPWVETGDAEQAVLLQLGETFNA